MCSIATEYAVHMLHCYMIVVQLEKLVSVSSCQFVDVLFVSDFLAWIKSTLVDCDYELGDE